MFPAAEIASLAIADFGEPVTLLFRSTSRTISALYHQEYTSGSPIDGTPGIEAYYLTATPADLAGVGPGWLARVRGVTRPVLDLLPDGSGLTQVLLGDPQ